MISGRREGRKYKGGRNKRPPLAHQRAFLHVRAMYESRGCSEIALNRSTEFAICDLQFAIEKAAALIPCLLTLFGVASTLRGLADIKIVGVDIQTEKPMNRMHSACVVGLGLMLCVVMRVRAADAPPEGFEPVFNGKDLSGFKPHDKQKMDDLQQHWTFKDDGVIAYNPAGKKGEMTLWTAKDYGDLVLMIDWRWVGPAQKMQRPYIDPATGEEKKDASGKVMSEEVLEYDSGVYLRGNPK